MSTKKKVQFSHKKNVKKFKQHEPSDSDDDSGSKNSDNELTAKGKHTLDSDEEDDSDKIEVLNRSALKGIALSNCITG